ncbi:MAG TPA: serine hydrolase domain-containing protein [Vicinamibacterales bacterium]|nr:serine hydrolase domain-containing protein [Vicinamibacterales bacterium]
MTLNGDAAKDVLEDAVIQRVFPGAAAEAGTSAESQWSCVTGHLTYEPGSPRVHDGTIYDLASLTKVMATTSIAMRLVGRGGLSLEARVSEWMPEWREGVYADVRVRDLLEHSAGLPGFLPLFRTNKGRDEFRRAIAALPPDYPPRQGTIYSDLGFIVLGHVLESAGGETLDALYRTFHDDARLPASLQYGVDAGRDIAPTEFDAWRGRLTVGEVHDENAFALGGAAPHAGLFGTAADAGAFGRLVLRTFRGETALGTPDLMRTFARRSSVPGSSRAVGWDTMMLTSSCGTRMAPQAIGHTGFTGTSLWIDPARDMYFVLLSNRVHPARDQNRVRIQNARRAFHDALLSD